MNFAEACVKALEHDEKYQNNKMTIKYYSRYNKIIFKINGNEYTELDSLQIIDYCQGEFRKAVDWDNVPQGTRLICTGNGYERERYFGGVTAKGVIRIAKHLYEDWNIKDCKLAEEEL